MPTHTNLTTWDAIKALYKPDDTIGIVLFSAKDQLHKPSPPARQKIVVASEAWTPTFQKWLRTQNAKGYNVSIAANPLTPGAKTRTKETVKEIRYLYLDLDTKNGVTGKQRLDTMLADANCPAPRAILNTSPDNFQVLWEVKGFTKESAEVTLRSLAAQYGGDLAIGGDVSRALRAPGLRNKKYAEHDPIQPSPASNEEPERNRLHGPTITGYIHSDAIHTPEQFAYLPAPDLAAPKSEVISQGLKLELPTGSQALPNGFDGPGKVAHARSGHGSSATDQTDSGRDWGHANYLFATQLKAGKSLAEITSEVRGYLITSAGARGRTDGPRYAETTLTKLLPQWEAKRAAYSPPPTFITSPAQHLSEAPTSPSFPVPGISATLPVGFQRTNEQQSQDAIYILQSLRDGQTPAQIRENMLDWHFKDVPGASDYIHAALKVALAAMESDRLITTAVEYVKEHGRCHDEDLGLFRTLISQHPDGEGTLSNVVASIQKAEDFLPPAPPALLPTEDHAAYVTAFQIAGLALNNGDTPKSIEAALSQHYYPALPSGSVAPDIASIVHQALLQRSQGPATFAQELPR